MLTTSLRVATDNGATRGQAVLADGRGVAVYVFGIIRGARADHVRLSVTPLQDPLGGRQALRFRGRLIPEPRQCEAVVPVGILCGHTARMAELTSRRATCG